MPQQISLTFTGDGSSAIDVDDGFQSMLIVTILEPTIDSAPSSISVSVVDAVGDSDIIFRIAGREVLREPADPDGVVDFISVPVPNFKNASGDSIMAPGIYTLEVIQGTSMGTDRSTSSPR